MAIMSEQIQYELMPQLYESPDLMVHEGKFIVAKRDGELIGRTGYVGWNTNEYKALGANTAHLMDLGNWPFDISSRLKGTGKKLLERVFEELALEGYDSLVISDVPNSVRGFYDKSLQRLKDEGKLMDYTCRTCGIISDDSDRFLQDVADIELLRVYCGINDLGLNSSFIYEVTIAPLTKDRKLLK
jgi:hypothetical protein